MPQRGVRFGPGTVVSPGEYRNTETGFIRYFDGNTPIPGGVNSPSWEQISDHYHAQLPESGGVSGTTRANPETPSRPVLFPPGTVVSSGEYRNVDTGSIRFFDGSTALPGGVNAPSWQQVSDHYHAQPVAGEHRTEPDRVSRPVAFGPGTVVSPGEYRNVDTGAVRWFDGNTPLPGGVNASSWVQISDHYHAEERQREHASPRDE
jgi:hypothetical protein